MTNSPAHPESQTSGAVRNCNNNCLGKGGELKGVMGGGLEELTGFSAIWRTGDTEMGETSCRTHNVHYCWIPKSKEHAKLFTATNLLHFSPSHTISLSMNAWPSSCNSNP